MCLSYKNVLKGSKKVNHDFYHFTHGGMYGESNMETYINKCKIDSQWEFGIRLSELKPGFSNILDGGMGRDV